MIDRIIKRGKTYGSVAPVGTDQGDLRQRQFTQVVESIKLNNSIENGEGEEMDATIKEHIEETGPMSPEPEFNGESI